MRRWLGDAFRSLQFYNYRLWAGGSLVSNIGSWMQRIAQDWPVLTVLTRHSASAVGVTTALQFAPQQGGLGAARRLATNLGHFRMSFAEQYGKNHRLLLCGKCATISRGRPALRGIR